MHSGGTIASAISIETSYFGLSGVTIATSLSGVHEIFFEVIVPYVSL